MAAAVPLLAVLAAAAPARPPAAPRPPNLLLILADDLGYGDLGCYGQRQIRTPNLDRMAAEGMRFTSFYAGSTVCAPSRCVLMTGLHTGHCRIRGNGKSALRPEDVTVAEVLKGAGYRTALIGKWGLGNEGTTGVPNRQGFDEFYGYLDQTHAHNYYPTFLFRNDARVPLRNVVPREGSFGQGVASRRVDYSHDLFAEEALALLDRAGDQPFFLFLAFTLPHANNEAGKAGMEVPDHGAYADRDWPAPEKGRAAMISRLDRDVGRLLERLKERGLDRRTLVLFSSDNGPHREGGSDPDFFDSNGPLRGIKRDLYEGGIRVPLIARWPGQIPPGATTNFVGYFPDFMPTAAELAGARAPQPTDGVSFLPTLRGEPERQRQHPSLYWEFYEQGAARAVRVQQWKGLCKPFGGPLQLFDLKRDPGESRSVAAAHPDVAARLRAAMTQAHVPSPEWKVRGAAGRE